MYIYDIDYGFLRDYYFVFKGDARATTGSPNRNTGRLSRHGFFYKFKSRESAQRFIDSNLSHTGVLELGSARQLRKYALGSSVLGYLNELWIMIAEEDLPEASQGQGGRHN